MVVDNADDAAVMFELWNGETYATHSNIIIIDHHHHGRSLSDFLPLSSHGSIVVTSRSREVVERLQVFSEDILNVEPMEMNVATRPVSEEAQEDRTRDDVPSTWSASLSTWTACRLQSRRQRHTSSKRHPG